MNPAGDYEIINSLNPKSKSDLFLVKRMATEELFVWRTISFKTMSKEKKDYLCKKIRKRIQQVHVSLVKFYPAIEEDKLKLVYVPMDYFPHGNLLDFINVLTRSETTHIPEDIIVKILFQLSILIKSIDLEDYISLDHIYFDDDFNVKFLNFSHSCAIIKFNVKMSDLGVLMMQLCMLNGDKLCNKFTVKKEHYSEELINLIEMMMKDNNLARSNIDNIITHPVILIKTFKLKCGINLKDCFELLEYRKKLEQLRKKEYALKLREDKIERKEYKLNAREKKIDMNEKAVRDKLTQAELYLKRCRENRNTQLNKYENVDNSLTVEYEEIEYEDNIETSKKLDVSKLKLQPIARSLSERKIKFKGHSPLKQINFNKPKVYKKHKENQCKDFTETKYALKNEKFSENSHRIKNDIIEDHRKSTFIKSSVDGLQNEFLDCRPIAWTKENKKQAFELLRIMNSNTDKRIHNNDVRHTFL